MVKRQHTSRILYDKWILIFKLYRMIVRDVMLFGSEQEGIKKKHNKKMSIVEMGMFRWMSCNTFKDQIKNEYKRCKLKVMLTEDKTIKNCLRYFVHVHRRLIYVIVENFKNFEVKVFLQEEEDQRKFGQEQLEIILRQLNLTATIVLGRIE